VGIPREAGTGEGRCRHPRWRRPRTGHEGEGGADQGRLACLTEIGEPPYLAAAAEVVLEEAGEGLGEPPTVVGVADEVAPVGGDALAPAQRLDGQPRQDIDDEVVGQAGRRRVGNLLPGRLRHLANKQGYAKSKSCLISDAGRGSEVRTTTAAMIWAGVGAS